MEVIKSSKFIEIKRDIRKYLNIKLVDFKDLLPEMSKDVEECLFMAIDGEFTGKIVANF